MALNYIKPEQFNAIKPRGTSMRAMNERQYAFLAGILIGACLASIGAIFTIVLATEFGL
jgi:hypothetical protein